MFEKVDAYLNKLHNADIYTKLDEATKEKIVFSAEELLKDRVNPLKINERIIALQTLYMLEGEEEEYAKLKRHGITSYSVKGVSVSFGNGDISPEVLSILQSKAIVGRLI